MKLLNSAVLCGYTVSYLILNEEHCLGIFKNILMRRLFRRTKKEEAVIWRNSVNNELYNTRSSPDIIWVIK